MALNNPSNLYSGGNVVLDSSPYLRIALQQRARKEARDSALDQYYQKLPETINDKGTRDQEQPIIAQLKNKIFETWVENKDAIRKGDPNAQLAIQKLYREAQAITRESQNAAKIDMGLGRMWLNKENQDLLNSDDYIAQHQQHNLPVTDPNYKPLDMGSVMANRPFDEDGFLKQIKGTFKYGQDTPTVTVHPTDKNLEVVTTKPKLDDATKENIYAFSADKLHNDIAFKRKLRKDFSTPDQLSQLNEVSKKVFGHEIDKEEDIAAAYTVSLLPPTQTVRQRVIPNVDQRNKDKNAEWDRRNKITFRQSMDKIAANKAAGVPQEDLGYLSDNVADEAGEFETIILGGKETQRRVIYVDKVDPERLNIITGRDIQKSNPGVPAIPIKQTDGKVRMGYYQDLGTGDWEGDNGQKISRERVKDAYINKYAPSKFKAQTGTQGQEKKSGSKQLTLAERMKAAKQKK